MVCTIAEHSEEAPSVQTGDMEHGAIPQDRPVRNTMQEHEAIHLALPEYSTERHNGQGSTGCTLCSGTGQHVDLQDLDLATWSPRTSILFLPITSSRLRASWTVAYNSRPTPWQLGARAFGVTINLAVGKEKARCWRNEVYAEGRAYPLLPLGRLANSLDTKFVWENGQALMQCRDKSTWHARTQLEVRSNVAYASQMQFEVLRRALWLRQAKPKLACDN